jgi:hypothetical protein
MPIQPEFFRWVRGICLLVAFLCLASRTHRGCTIFVLKDTNSALFCNNEDWSDPNTRIWFQPSGEGYHGAVYVGFENGWAQGGMNTEGLSYDWVAGFSEEWNPNSKMPIARGNSSQRMLETCTTISAAIAFYRSHYEADFSRAKILVADRSGASVIIGAHDGHLQIEEKNQCRGFGYAWKMFDTDLARNSEATVANGFQMLRDCIQKGQYATKYSIIYDLKSGEIFLNHTPGRQNEVKLNLKVELAKGSHYYNMERLSTEITQAPRPLPLNMQRFPMDAFEAASDQEPKITAQLKLMLKEAAMGNAHPEHYSAAMWEQISPHQKEIQSDLNRLGDFISMTLVDHRGVEGQQNYRYKVEFGKATVLQYFVLDNENKVKTGGSELVEWKPGAQAGEFKGPEKSQ